VLEPTGSYVEALNLFEQFRQWSDLSSLQKCIEIYRALLAEKADGMDRHFISAKPAATRPSSYPSIYHVWIQLARAHEARFHLIGESCDMDFAIKYGQDAVESCQTEKTLCPTVMVYYAQILDTKATHAIPNSSDSGYEERRVAEALCRQAITLLRTGKEHHLWTVAHNVLGWTMFRSYELNGNVEDLEEAVALQRLALAQISTSQCSDRHWHLRCLGVELRDRFERLLDPRDLDESISLLAEAMHLCNTAHVDRLTVACGMIQGLGRKYFVSGAIECLDQANDVGRQVLSIQHHQALSGRSYRSACLLSAISITLMLRYQIGGHEADNYESVSLSREALCSSNRNSWTFVCNHVNGLISQFELDGNLGHLEESVLLIRQILATLPNNHRAHSALKRIKASVMACRFDVMREIDDLNESIDLCREALADDPWDYDPAPVLQLVDHLCDRFQVLHQADDLEQAIPMLNQVLESIPQGHMQHLEAVHRLSKALSLRGQHINLNDCGDIDCAIHEITCHREELIQAIIGPESLRTLAACYFLRYRRTGDVIYVGYAFDIMTNLVQTVKPGRRYRFSCLVYAAELYLEDTPHHDVAMALEHVSAALTEPQRDVRSRVQGVKTFLDMVETRYSDLFTMAPSKVQLQLLDMYASVIALLPRIAFFGTQLLSRLQSLSMGQSVALSAASHALKLSLPERALEILEQGRAIFWTHSLRLRSAFDDVPEQFRSQLFAIARKLERVNKIPWPGNNRDLHSFEDEAVERRRQTEEFNSLVEQVRCLPGMNRFLLHDSYSKMAKVAERGPVIVLVSSTLACHAVLIKASGEALGIPLNVVTESWLVSSGAVWRSAVMEVRSIARDINGRKMVKLANPRTSQSAEAEDILRRLWESVVWPVINTLGIKVR
jgi:tetratricopeptide (TPR) repeat protein